MADYKKLQLQQFAKTSLRNNETRYWEKFVSSTATTSLLAGELQDDADASSTTQQFQPTTPLQHYAKVTHLTFNPTNNRELACTASTRITMYDTGDMSQRTISPIQAIKQITRFKSTAYSGNYRPTDGKLLIGSNDQGMISVFDAGSRSVLRQLRNGHSAAVTVCQFNQHDITKAYSGSDDSTLALWDVQTETQLQQWSEWQSDYIRTIQQHPTAPHLIYAGSYDHSLCQYDTRQPTDEQPSLLVNHGQPIEASLMLNNGTIILTAGSNTIKVWDLLNSGKLLTTISAHQKTITSLAMDSSGSRLLSGGLDQYVKVYDTSSYEVTHSIQYSSPVMSLAINNNNTVLAVGLLDGTLDIRRRPQGVEKHEKILAAKAARAQRKLPGNTKRYFQRGGSIPPDDVEVDIVVKRHRTKKFQPHDQLLRKFEYSAALDSVIATNRASLIYSLMNELIDRNALKLALSGRDEQSLAPIISFINSYIIHPHYSTLLVDITHQLIDIYTAAIGQSPTIDELLVKLQHIISEEKNTQYQLLGVQGQVSALLSTVAGNLSQTTIDVMERQKVMNGKQLTDGNVELELRSPAGENGVADYHSSDASID